jgi:hypothetical protein
MPSGDNRRKISRELAIEALLACDGAISPACRWIEERAGARSSSSGSFLGDMWEALDLPAGTSLFFLAVSSCARALSRGAPSTTRPPLHRRV